MEHLKPHFWLYENDHDARLICENCIHYGEPQAGEACGRAGWICGDFRLNEEYQITMEVLA